MRVRNLRTRFALLLAPLAAGCSGPVSVEEEAELGAAYAQEIAGQVELIQDPAALAELNRLGSGLPEAAHSTARRYTFYLADSPDINALAIPGGHVFVNRGLIERADELDELAGVLGHEIAHVTERHGIEQVEKQRGANLLLTLFYMVTGRDPGLLEQVVIRGGGAAVFAKYSRDAEREADRRAIDFLIAAGYHPEGMVTFFEELLREQQRTPTAVEQWFSSHPTSQERIDNARLALQQSGAGGSLVRDTPEYQRFRARVRAIP